MYAQDFFKSNSYRFEMNNFLSTSQNLPFWLASNRNGEVQRNVPSLQFIGEIQHEYDSLYNSERKLKKFNLGYGIRNVVNISKTPDLRLSEGFIKARFRSFEFYAGRRREIIGLIDSTLSSGSYIWSGNALPIPKIQISIPNYTPITKEGLISIKGSFNHGWFGSSDSVQRYYLHQKNLYARFGKPKWRFKFYSGINHQVQWGGRPTYPFYDSRTEQIITKFPSDLSSYINVVTGLSLNRKLDAGIIKDGTPYNEAYNRAGNHLGTVDLAIDYFTPKGTILLYRQSIFEDGSLFYLNNISDGLVGASFKSSQCRKGNFIIFERINVEYLKTSNQGGNIGSGGKTGNINQLRGLDNYFNNSLYKDGYTYKKQTIGTPFIMPISIYEDAFPKYQGKGNFNYLLNNRIKAFHIATQFSIGKSLELLLRYSRTRNLGNYISPVLLIQNSLFLQTNYSGKDWRLIFSLSMDNGNLLNNSIGSMISFQKQLFY